MVSQQEKIEVEQSWRMARGFARVPQHYFQELPSNAGMAGDGYLAKPLPRSNATTDGNEKAALMCKSTNPSKLCQPAFKAPVVFGSSEQLLRVLTEHCAWIR